MSDYQKIIAMLSSDNQAECLNHLLILLRKTFKDISVTFFRFNEIDRVLTEESTGYQIKLSTQNNPIAYSFVTMTTYFINKVLGCLEFPITVITAKQCSGQCLLIPLKLEGVLAFFSEKSDLSCEKNKRFLQDISAIFQCALRSQLNQLKQKDREKQVIHQLQSLQKRDSRRLMASHLEHQWIDVSGRSKSFKRDILYHTQTRRPLMIVGEKGIGRFFLAKQIQYLRNTYGYQPNRLNLAKITNIIQLKSLFNYGRKKASYFNFRYDNTLILQNLDSLSPPLFNQLYESLCNDKKIIEQNVKIITTSQRQNYHQNCTGEAIAFFTQETLLLSNRLLETSNITPFVMRFIADYCQRNLKIINGISSEALELLVAKTALHTPKTLKTFIIQMCDDIPDGGKIDKAHISHHLSNISPAALSDTLTNQVKLYEKSIILKTLALNDWNQKASAKQLGIPRRTLSYKCVKLNIGSKYGRQR